MTLFSGLGTDVHFFGDETGLHWEDYLFELQNAVEWRMVMSSLFCIHILHRIRLDQFLCLQTFCRMIRLRLPAPVHCWCTPVQRARTIGTCSKPAHEVLMLWLAEGAPFHETSFS